MDKKILIEAAQAAGYREQSAMTPGKARRKKDGAHELYVFTYSSADAYQDGNGATYDATAHKWTN